MSKFRDFHIVIILVLLIIALSSIILMVALVSDGRLGPWISYFLSLVALLVAMLCVVEAVKMLLR